MHRNGKGRVLKKMVLKEWWSLVCIFSMLEEDVTQEWEGKISEKVVLKRSTTSHHAGPQGFHDRHHGYSCGISHCYHCAPLYRQWLQSPLSLCTTVPTMYTCGYSHRYHCAPLTAGSLGLCAAWGKAVRALGGSLSSSSTLKMDRAPFILLDTFSSLVNEPAETYT